MSFAPIVVVMAAGQGTRMKSARAKVLHPVAGRPLISWAVENARAAGASDVVAVLGHQFSEVKSFLESRYGVGTIAVAEQAEQRGTGHAVMCALPSLESQHEERVVVILTGDAPLLQPHRVAELVNACENSESKFALLSTHPTQPVAYGRLIRDANGKLLRIIEDADATEQEKSISEMNAGFYAIRLKELREHISKLSSNNAQGELYLTDLAAAAADRGGATVIDAPYLEVSGINDRMDLARVEAEARRRISHGHMAAGVTIVDPESTFIDADVGPIGRDTVIHAGVCLRGKTTIGAGVNIEPGCVLTDCNIGANTWIKPYSVLTNTVLGANVQIGPFTHCRPDSRVDDGAKVGNFVETKKTHIMSGAKANHLAYLGDASVGANANVGAGTITCNYDGFNKHKTTIESGAFIGSDTQLVAPVTVGRDAYVGAGSTVTKDVPRASLALTRVKQVNVEGWADRFRAAQGKRKNR